MKKKNVLILILAGCIAFCPGAFAQNVGIGTTTPAYKLDVKGHINISQDSFYRINKVPVLSIRGSYNIFVGPYAGASTPPYPIVDNNGSGSWNTAMGYEAGYNNFSGDANTYIGFKSGRTASSASHNAFLGYGTGLNNSGSDNTFLGAFSGSDNTGGYNNVFVGTSAGTNNKTGANNVFVGDEAGYDNTEGHYNTFVGAQAGSNNITGDYNTFLGYNARPSSLLPNLTNAMAIGYNTQVFGSNHVRIGNTNVTSIGGYAGWSDLSDGRFKVNVQEAVQGLAFIKRLRPVTYNLDLAKLDRHLQVEADSISNTPAFRSARAAKEQELHSGFIAQEVEQAAKALGFHFSGVDLPQNDKDTYKLRYAEFTVPLVKAVQELAAENEALKKELAELKKLVQKLVTSD
ncbi:hypothetical protein HB364_27120 [Pseudoflavitalea sp. X16]|uniref:tail fiber domain-containing protein n=1 Tax=Paraflavitalea devenefica TaxID=2716334 RepID=UPI0014235E8D|nr:tail fiber domain-containing protein [Paraflavitalea devenefica]NII28783.1 hypothetical protein [Paraflavitalea devenefica]